MAAVNIPLGSKFRDALNEAARSVGLPTASLLKVAAVNYCRQHQAVPAELIAEMEAALAEQGGLRIGGPAAAALLQRATSTDSAGEG